ncbi:MAG: hypothetical protein M3680_20885 [Myxococcota bacterium]|nr:hypothetical protein [Myxococcota bacterium]
MMSLVGACYAPDPRAGAPCVDDSQCPSVYACIGGYCGGAPALADALDDAELVDAAVVPPDAPPAGFCVLAADCANTDPCRDVACVSNRCVTTTRADGASCGAGAAARCCGGSCRDLTSDEAHCGGCGQACATGRTCETVAATNTCSSSPAETSGRCTCAGANAECPDDQICRTVTPFANRCSPNSNASCAGGQTAVEVQQCPNYCRYP